MNINICPFCSRENLSTTKNCQYCNKPLFVQPQTEWKGQIEQTVKGYKSGNAKGLAHGLQKDAIQNSWGACKNKNEWSTTFNLIYTGEVTYLTITDKGTFGLSGKIYDNPEEIPDKLPEEERLSRFENMNFSGENSGPGLYGRGKLIFQASSVYKTIIYDSLIENGEYRLGQRFLVGRKLQQTSKILQNENAKKTLMNLTNNILKPLTNIGTRITIINPLEEIINSIESGDFLKYIEETWWEILHNYNAKISVINNGTEKFSSCPEILKNLLEKNIEDSNYYCNEDITVSVIKEPYKIKRICFAKSESEIANELQGLFIQRKGMKIGNVDLKYIPEDLKDKFFGYILLDRKFENKIVESEDLEHYGFSSQFASFRELKKEAQANFDRFKGKLGYDVEKDQNEDEKARKALLLSETKLNQILKNLGLSGIGQSKRSRDIIITLKKAIFPTDTKKVKFSEQIKDVEFNVKNKSYLGKIIKVLVETKTSAGKIIEKLYTNKVELVSGQSKIIGPLFIKIDEMLYPDNEEVSCYCFAEESGKIIAQSKFSIFINKEPPQIAEPISILLKNIEWPNQETKRVNYGEEIKNITYLIKNEYGKSLKIKFALRTEETEDKHIENIFEKDILLDSFAEQTMEIPSIVFSKEKYSDLEPGILQIRSRALSLKKQFNIKKGKKLAKHIIKIWFNCDEPGFGIFEKSDSFSGGPDKPRALVKPESAGRWTFSLNITHPNYEAVKDEPNLSNSYVFELMTREALYIALYSENFDAFKQQVKQGDQPHEVSKTYNITLDKILTKYYS